MTSRLIRGGHRRDGKSPCPEPRTAPCVDNGGDSDPPSLLPLLPPPHTIQTHPKKIVFWAFPPKKVLNHCKKKWTPLKQILDPTKKRKKGPPQKKFENPHNNFGQNWNFTGVWNFKGKAYTLYHKIYHEINQPNRM